MKKRGHVSALLLVFLVIFSFAACHEGSEDGEEGELLVYYAVGDRNRQVEQGLIDAVPVTLPENTAAIDFLLELLFAQPLEEGLYSPYPAGTDLLSFAQNGERIVLYLSEDYGELSGLDATIADYCIAMTLCQLDGVESVSIYVENGGERFALRPGDVVLDWD